MNVCAKCTHFRRQGRGRVWYDLFCHHPSKARVLTVDPVLGEPQYMTQNDLGRKMFVDSEFPNARDVNTDGECRLHEGAAS